MKRARYQVTLNGFHVNRETYDDQLQFDGKRDEVFAQWANTKIDADGQVVYTATGRTPVMGDVNNMPGRVNAGTASDEGGLPTGDSSSHARKQVSHLPAPTSTLERARSVSAWLQAAPSCAGDGHTHLPPVVWVVIRCRGWSPYRYCLVQLTREVVAGLAVGATGDGARGVLIPQGAASFS